MFRTSFVLAAWAVIHLAACHNQDEPHPYGNDGLEGHVHETRYLALGDSYTIGESVLESERWPNQLVDSLRERLGSHHEVLDATLVATTGWTTANLEGGMDAAQVDTAEWDLVSLLIGVNNQYQGLPIEAYGPEFSALLERAIALAGGDAGRVFVVSIPDYGYTPFGVNNQSIISSELAQFNDTCRVRTVARGVAHFDITPISQEWPYTPGLVAADGLHPSGVQYGRWVASFADEVADLLHP